MDGFYISGSYYFCQLLTSEKDNFCLFMDRALKLSLRLENGEGWTTQWKLAAWDLVQALPLAVRPQANSFVFLGSVHNL